MLVLVFMMSSTASEASACSASSVVLTSKVPLAKGTVIFQATSSSQQYLYLFDVPSHAQKNLSLAWSNIYDPENGHFSPNGKYIVFTAVTCPDLTVRTPSCPTTDVNARTDAFIWQVGASAPVGLTTGFANQRYEDVIFTPNGKAVLMKVAGNIARFPISFRKPALPVLGAETMLTDTPESSGPYPTFDGAGLYFWENSDESAYVDYLPYGGVATPISAPNTTMTYFPVTRSDGAAFVVAHDGNTDPSGDLVDQIYMATATGAPFTSLSLNSCSSDNSDPAPVGTHYLLFGNTRNGSYQAFLGDIANGKIWALGASFGLGSGVTDVLGYSYTTRRLSSQ